VEIVVPEESLVLCYVFEALSFVLIHVGCANLAKGCLMRAQTKIGILDRREDGNYLLLSIVMRIDCTDEVTGEWEHVIKTPKPGGDPMPISADEKLFTTPIFSPLPVPLSPDDEQPGPAPKDCH